MVCLCGSNTKLRARLDALATDGRVRTEGFTTRMCEWLAAAAVLVHSTAGLTVLEAELCGTWAISYGWGVGHIRLNNAAYRRFGLADVATTPAELAERFAFIGATQDALAPEGWRYEVPTLVEELADGRRASWIGAMLAIAAHDLSL